MASVWKNRGSLDLVTAKPSTSSTEIIPDDDSCDICCGEDGACDVYFSPCGHKACASCVQRMRIANIYKADKGVRCPFCRQVIELYLNSPPPSPSADSQLPREAASFTLFLSGLDTGPRAVTKIKKPYGRGGIISIGGGNDYIPPKGVTGSDGGGLRSSTRMDELLPGYIVPPLKDTDDIVSMAMDRTGARHLDFMLREGYAKRHKVAKLCREMLTPYAAKLAVHASGNYVLQRMLEYASTHRGEGSNAECFFTAIVRSFCQEKGLVTAAQDHRGTFSVQKMLVSLKGAEEATLVAECIQGSVVTLVLDQYGVYVLERLVEALITSMNAAQGKKPRVPPKVAFKILAQICKEIQADTKALSSVAKHQVNNDTTITLCGVSGIMLVECIRWALPQDEAMAAAMTLAQMSNELAGSKLANRTLQGVLSLEVKDVAEQLIKGLQGRYVELATDTVNFGFKLVRACLASPCVGESTRLLIVDELLYAVLHPAGHVSFLDISSGCDALAFGLCLLTQRVLDERLDTLVMVLERDKFLHFRDGMESLRKLFFIGPPAPSASQGNSETRSSTLASVMRARSHDPSSSVEMALDPSFGSRQGVSDPWSEESPSGSTFRLEKPLTHVASLPMSQPAPPHLQISPLDLSSAASLAGLSERHSTHTNATSSGGSTDRSGSSVGVGVYTPPHLRGISGPTFPPSNYSSTSVSSLSMQLGGISVSSDPIPPQPASGRIASKPGSYAPPHLQNPTLSAVSAPTGFSDPRFGTGASSSGSFENEHGNGDSQQISSGDGGQSSLSLPTAEIPRGSSFLTQERMDVKKSRFQEGQEVGKAAGGHRQSGVCAVCNQDAANTVLLDCSHMCCCTTCSRSISVCPICSNRVTGVIDIQPVGLPPLNLLPSPRATPNSPSVDLWDMATRSSNSNHSVDSSGFLTQSKEGASHPPFGLSQFQGSQSSIDTNPNSMGSYTTAVGGRAHSPFERLSLEEQYPASVGTSRAGAATASSIPLITPHVTGSHAIGSLQQGSYGMGSRGMSSQITESYSTGSVAVGSTSITSSMSSSVMIPHYLPSDFYLPGKYTGTTGYSVVAPVISSLGSSIPPIVAQKIVPPSNPSRPSFPPQQQGSVLHFPPPPHRPRAPYRPPGLYRPPDLFSQKGSPAVVSQADIMAVQSIQAGNIAPVVPPQWRTY